MLAAEHVRAMPSVGLCAVNKMAADASDIEALIARWQGRVPIMLGVTGHRNIDMQNEALKNAVRQQCRNLKRKYPSSPFAILSGLAEGADRLVARIAMEELDAALIVVLPVPRAEFETDFDGDISRAEFSTLIERAFCVKEAPIPQENADWKGPGEARNQQYAKVGAIIVDHCQILLAIWDREKSRGIGGTAEVVEWFERGFSPARYSLYKSALSPLDPPEPGRRIHVDPRSGKVSIVEGPPEAPGLKPKRRRSEIDGILRRTERYNKDILGEFQAIAGSQPLAPAEVMKANSALFTDAAYHSADCLSVQFASNIRSADAIVYAFALIAFFSFNFLNEYPLASWVYLGVILVMLLLAGRVWFWSIDNRFHEYRSLAEAMRIMFFWRLAGVRRPVWLTYLSRHSGVVHWIRHSIRSLEFCQDCLLPTGADRTQDEKVLCLAAVQTHWIGHQIEWFVNAEDKHERHYKRWILVARLAIGGSFIIAAVLAALAMYYGESGFLKWGGPMQSLSEPLQIVLGTLAAAGLAARGFLARRADHELTKHYASQRQIFEIAKEVLDKLRNGTQSEWTAEQILERLGEEALQEQAEWLWLRHSRPFEVPS